MMDILRIIGMFVVLGISGMMFYASGFIIFAGAFSEDMTLRLAAVGILIGAIVMIGVALWISPITISVEW